MKRYHLLYFVVVLFLFTSCEDEDLKPILTFEDAGKGAFVRLVSLNRDLVIDPTKISESGIDMDVDFVDPQGGQTITDYNIFISFVDNTPDNGDATAEEALIRSFGTSDFSTSEMGNPGLNVNIPAADMLSTLGLAESDLSATDRFTIRSEIIDQEGRVFSAANSAPPIANFMDAFNGAFRYNLNVACPVADDFYAGTYQMEYVTEPNTGGFGPIFGDPAPTVELEAAGSTVRSFSVIYIPGAGGFEQTFTIDLLCDLTQVRPLDSGLACSTGSITLSPGTDFGSMSLSDDSEMTITLINNVTDGGCGLAPYENVIRLVKQ